MAEYIKEESNVLVINGVPYSLVHPKNKIYFNVCLSCDLSDLCEINSNRYNLIDLCSPMNDVEPWFFKIDWDVLNNKIRDYIDLGSAVSEDKL